MGPPVSTAEPALERPKSIGALSSLLGACRRDSRLVLPMGAGRSPAAGGRPAFADVELDLRAIAGVIAFEPDDLTLTARAGTPMDEITATIAGRGLILPGAPPDSGTLGGLLACGWTCPGDVATHGRIRDRVLGMQVVSSDGVATRSGGRVVKNVAGLDLHRMHCGALGAFGVITEATLRLEPAPEAVVGLVLETDSIERAIDAWRWTRREGPDASALGVREDEGVRMTAVFAGDREPAQARHQATAGGWSRFGRVRTVERGSAEVEDALLGPLHAPRNGLSLTLTLRPSRVLGMLHRLRAEWASSAMEAVAFPDLGAIHVAASGPRDALGNLWEAAARAAMRGESHYRVEDVPAGLLRSTPAWSADPFALFLLARLKHEFDPAGILRPGSWSTEELESAGAYFAAELG